MNIKVEIINIKNKYIIILMNNIKCIIKTKIQTCIIIPSHINNITRIKLLLCCLQSLINQTNKIPIYLSISFETELDKLLFNKLIEKNNLLNNIFIFIIYHEEQTSQFRHIEKIINNIKDEYTYIMFCDDDDTYEIERVEKFMNIIEYGCNNCPQNKLFVGAYERNLQETHSIQFYEYWSYCVNIHFIINFINIIKINNYDYIFNNKMCDVLFSTYLRTLDNNHVFVSINEKLYNYNKNSYNSITEKISKNNIVINKIQIKLEINFEIFIQKLNKSIEENIENIKNNIFVLYTMSKMSFENILKNIFVENYKYKNKINKKILEKLKFEYDNIKYLCDILYNTK